jgi:hypothetical protein
MIAKVRHIPLREKGWVLFGGGAYHWSAPDYTHFIFQLRESNLVQFTVAKGFWLQFLYEKMIQK